MMGLIWTVVIGFVAGLIARALKKGDDSMGTILTIVLGIAGAFLAKFLGQMLGWYNEGETAGFIASVLGAIALLFLYGMIKKK